MKKKKQNKNAMKKARIENFSNQTKELLHRREILENSLLVPNDEISELKSILNSINKDLINKRNFIESTINEIVELGKESGKINNRIDNIEREKSRIMLVINETKRDEKTLKEEIKNLK